MRIDIKSIADAVGFLAEKRDLIAVQLEIVPPLWKVVSLDGEFEALFSDLELMEFARNERDMRVVLSAVAAKEARQAAGDQEVRS